MIDRSIIFVSREMRQIMHDLLCSIVPQAKDIRFEEIIISRNQCNTII